MLEIDALRVAIQSVEVLRGVSLTVNPGEMVGLVGRNGAGKTTTLRAVMGLVGASGGAIRFAGEDLGALATHRRTRRGIGYMPEDRRLVPQLSVEENILLPSWVTPGLDGAARLAVVYGLMPEVAALAARKALLLSGGQQKLVALARALVVGSDLLLLDEPTEGLAPALARRLSEVIAKLRGTGLTVLVAESNMTHLGDLLDDAFIIERGAVRRRVA